jgi:hypothetical protein
MFLTSDFRDPLYYKRIFMNTWSYGRSVSIVSDYRLDDRATGVRSPAKDFSSSLCVQTGSEAHPASCPMSTGCTFPGGNRKLVLTVLPN